MRRNLREYVQNGLPYNMMQLNGPAAYVKYGQKASWVAWCNCIAAHNDLDTLRSGRSLLRRLQSLECGVAERRTRRSTNERPSYTVYAYVTQTTRQMRSYSNTTVSDVVLNQPRHGLSWTDSGQSTWTVTLSTSDWLHTALSTAAVNGDDVAVHYG